MKIQYLKAGDYLIPAIEGPKPLAHPLSKIGRTYREHMKKNHPLVFNEMVMTNTWTEHLQEIDETANRRMEQMIAEMAKEAGATESLKAADPLRWVSLMNSIKDQAEEVVFNELVFN